MGEKRKPSFTMLLKYSSKESKKVELFDKELWQPDYSIRGAKLYRIRVNGKWLSRKNQFGDVVQKYFTKWEFRDMLFRSLRI